MRSEFLRVIPSPIGPLTLRSDGERILALDFGAAGDCRDALPLLLRAEKELMEYFAGRRRSFSVPLCMEGTQFQLLVRRALAELPYGSTASYGQIARSIGRPRACRAVGMACGKNPLPIFIPCHRVLGADGALTGYAGGTEAKRFLLELEKGHVEI